MLSGSPAKAAAVTRCDPLPASARPAHPLDLLNLRLLQGYLGEDLVGHEHGGRVRAPGLVGDQPLKEICETRKGQTHLRLDRARNQTVTPDARALSTASSQTVVFPIPGSPAKTSAAPDAMLERDQKLDRCLTFPPHVQSCHQA